MSSLVSMTMCKLVIASVCFICLGQGARITAQGRTSRKPSFYSRTLAEASQPRGHLDDRGSFREPVDTFAALLLAHKPAAAYNQLFPGVRIPVGDSTFLRHGVTQGPHSHITGLRSRGHSSAIRMRAPGEPFKERTSGHSTLPSDRVLSPGLSRAKFLAGAGGLAAAALLAAPRTAEASFGSARGAVTSPPNLKLDADLDSLLQLDPRKEAQVQSLLKPGQIEQLRLELKQQANRLENQIESTLMTADQREKNLQSLREKQDLASQQVAKLKGLISDQDKLVAQLRSRIEKKKQDFDAKQRQSSEQAAKAGTKRAAGAPQQYPDEKEDRQLLAKEEANLMKMQKDLERATSEQAAIEDLLSEQVRMGDTSAVKAVVTAARAELERKQELEARIAKRASVLKALDDQPDWFNYVAAFLASCISTCIMHPIDTLKTREVAGEVEAMPTETADGETNDGAPDAAAETSTDSEASKDDPISELLSLYQGLSGNLFKEGPPSAAYLGVYELAKTNLLANPTLGPYPLLVYLISGALGECVGSVIRAPAEAIKSRVQTGIDPNTGESIQRVLIDPDGRANVIRAWSASLWRDVPFGGIQLAIFEGLKSFIINSPSSFLDVDVNSLAAEVVLGATGGGIGALLTTPMDVCTTRIMMQGAEGGSRLGFLGMGQKILADGGFSELMTGAKARTFYWAPAIGIFLASYCSIRQAAIANNLF